MADHWLSVKLLVGVELVLDTVKSELPAIDPVAETADHRTEKPFLAGLERADVTAALHDIVNLTVTVGNADPDDPATIIRDLHTGSGRVDKAVDLSRCAVRQGAEAFAGDTSGGSCRRVRENGSHRQDQS